MAAKIGVEKTHFTLDVLGRYTCNTDMEAAEATNRPDARPFDVIVIGGGSFGPILAQNVFFDDTTHSRRVLVLDAGPLALPEHQQNLPVLGDVESVVREVPWQADPRLAFSGLRIMLGGRSAFFGGWSPQLLDDALHTEMPRTRWPDSVVQELKTTYFPGAAQQLAVDETNDFIFGELHEVLRQRLAAGIDNGKVTGAIPLDDLELRLRVDPATPAATQRLMKLEAPLAVQSKSPRPGFFPFNKFSAVPLIIRSAREAQFEVGELLDDRTELGENERKGDDAKKRYMVVPRIRVTRLETGPGADGQARVTGIHARRLEANGSETDVAFPVREGARVVIALGTIESARLVLNSFSGLPRQDLVGANLMAHLRSNVVMRIPRGSLPGGLPRELQASALLMKGAHRYQDGDGATGYFHLQITSAGLDNLTDDDHVELFMKVPDIDFFEDVAQADDQHVVITIRGIGEMEPDNPASRVVPEPGTDRVRAMIVPSARDEELWDAMDRASDQVARVFAGGKDFEIRMPDGRWKPVTPASDLEQELPFTFRDQGRFDGEAGRRGRRDRLGTTHHEAGTLRLGSSPDDSVVDENCRLWGVENAYVAGPMLFPTIGSPNPMLTGTAFARRLATHLVETMPHHVPVATPGFTLLFDGRTLGGWRMSTIRDENGQEAGRTNPGRFIVVDGALEATPGTGLGLLWHAEPMPPDYVLKLQWKRFRHEANSGVLLRFPDPRSKGYRNTAWVASHFGYEVQIDELGAPDGADRHRTGAIYGVEAQTLSLQGARPAGEWNDYEIRVEGNRFTVLLNGVQVTDFLNGDPDRGQPSTDAVPTYVGLQIHPGSRMAFRNVEFRPL
ncbi:MAG TPA: family 16 glycoside hydrolase [Longimicrobiaceae bacterium]|nr:family 16 glycoside hydrolase [Longimicrobiaceae bacterium]